MADVGLPLILFQLQPALAGVNFEPDTLRAMAAVEGVVAIKEASFDARRFVDTARLLDELPRPITLLTGNDNFILESFMLGATGALIGFGAVMTREQVDMIDAWNDGRIEDAKALGRRVQRLADVVFARRSATTASGSRSACGILGVLENANIRRPLMPLSDAERTHLAAVLTEVGLLREPVATGSSLPESGGVEVAKEPADVLIIGAGASGGVVAKRLSEAGFKVVCLEQGDWLDRADYPGNKPDWELKARKDWATSPNLRGLAADYPIVEEDTPVSPLMYNAVGGSTIIFAGAWPRALPSDFRVRSLDGIADDWPIDYFELLPYFYRTDRDFGVSGLPGDPAYPPDAEDAPMPPLPIGAAGLKVARGMTKLGWHWWPEFNSINSVAYDGRRPCVQRSTCQSGCNEGAKASTDLTHWPKAIANGARLVTGARVRRIETDAKGLATGATWIDRDGGEHFEPAKVVVLAANAIGTPRLLLLSASSAASGRPGELVRPRRQAADDASVRQRRRPVRGPAEELGRPVRRPHRVARVLRDRREARLRPRRPLGPGPDRWPDQHRAAEPRRRADLGCRPPPACPVTRSATAPTGACSPRTCPTRPTTSRCRPRSPTRPASRRPRSTTGCRTTRAGCSTSTSSGRRSRWMPPVPTRSRSTD